jgi:hypothetical protein
MSRLWLPSIVIGAVLASLALSGWRLSHQIAAADLDAAATAVRDGFVAGDLIIVDPPFMSGPRERLGDLPLVAPRTLVADDLFGVARVQLLSLDAIGVRPEVASTLAALGTLAAERAFGGVAWRTYRLAAARHKLFDLRESVAALVVTARYADGVEGACKSWDRDRWTCPRDPSWSYVGRETLNIDSEPRDCVWLHPLPAGGVLKVELPAVAGDRESVLAGGFGFALESARRVKAPVHVELWSGQERLFVTDHEPQVAWRRFQIPFVADPATPLRLEVSTKDNGASHFCMSLALYGAAP